MIVSDRHNWLPLFAKIFLGGTLVVALVCLSMFELHRRDHLARLISEKEAIVHSQATIANIALHRIRADLIILARQNERFEDERSDEDLQSLRRVYSDFAQTIGYYEQIRLLKIDGTGILGVFSSDWDVDQNTLAPVSLPDDQRYIQSLLEASPGLMLMDCRIDPHITTPRPILFFAVAINAPLNPRTIDKILLLNYRADSLFLHLAQLGSHGGGTFILSDHHGYWINLQDASDSWDFQRFNAPDLPLAKAYPDAWNTIQRQENGVINSRNDIFIFATIHPALKGFWGIGDPPNTKPRTDVNEWKIISHISSKTISEVEYDILEALAPMAIASLVALGLGSWIFSVSWQNQQYRHLRLMHRATIDALTGVLNRAAFDDQLKEILADYHEQGDGFAILYIDLDDFKSINDLYGHDAGDACLREAVARIRDAIRDTDVVGRIGGDEFAIILSPCKNRQTAQLVIDKIRAALRVNPAIPASLGLAICPEDGTNAELLLRSADQAMYGFKRHNRIARDDPDPSSSQPPSEQP